MTVAETACDDCGLVLADEGVDTGPEWRSFDDTKNRKRTGAPRTPARHDRGLSTEIGWVSDGQGTALSSRKRRRLSRLRTHQSRAQFRSKAERNEMHGLTDIRRMTDALGLSTGVRDRACRLFLTAQTEDLLRGRSIGAMAAASVYATCRCSSRPQRLGDVARVAQVSDQTVQNGYDVLNQELGLLAPPRAPDLFLARFCSALGFSTSVEGCATAVLEQGRRRRRTGLIPRPSLQARCWWPPGPAMRRPG